MRSQILAVARPWLRWGHPCSGHKVGGYLTSMGVQQSCGRVLILYASSQRYARWIYIFIWQVMEAYVAQTSDQFTSIYVDLCIFMLESCRCMYMYVGFMSIYDRLM